MFPHITKVGTSILIFFGTFLSGVFGYFQPQTKIVTVIPITAATSTQHISEVVSVPPHHASTTETVKSTRQHQSNQNKELGSSVLAQVISNAITITAPATGSTVAPGQTLPVSVSVAPGTIQRDPSHRRRHWDHPSATIPPIFLRFDDSK